MDQTNFFKCLSDPTRLEILKLVMSKQEVCVCEITSSLAFSQPKISRHLALLRHHHILLDERRGQWVYYRLNPQLPHWAITTLNVLNEPLDSSQPNLTPCCNTIPVQCD